MNRKIKICIFVNVFFACVLLLSGCEKSISVLKNEEVVEENAAVYSEEDKDDITGEIVLQEEKTVFVDIAGAVVVPGVYELPYGARIFQALEAAGGCTEEADTINLNQAQVLSDGQKIYVYTKQEIAQAENLGIGEDDSNSVVSYNGKININQADKGDLMALPGVGETRAEAILSYRERNGVFSSIEELMNVEGIKEKTYEKLKDKITV